ncbi:Intramolecular chaperone auto-processing domain containing protein [uncultured Caudovirales phage]|uniref:Intramolecular chaperone auto-processing domain containing protein n=1 Tax=uncultured Caudovirales phage TaxID=2100421 RepID=A0A6J5MCR3_9CAUD|nr:Intramolecular chaperone auto-processing domain containing protein [uncultured Caudovirales phage]
MLKTISSITNAIGALNYKGTWNASANLPPLASGVGTKGDYYVVGTAGSTNLDGITNWGIGDWAAFNGSVWQRVEGGANLNGVDLSVSGTSTLSGLTASTALALNASKQVVSVTNTGTGNNVLATSPTLSGTTTIQKNGTANTYNPITVLADGTYPNSGYPAYSFTTFSGGNGYEVAFGAAGSAAGVFTPTSFGLAPILRWYTNGFGGETIAATDNAYSWGASGGRWSAIWAANGTIQTSDAREKNSVQDSALGLDFIKSLRPVSYKWNVGGNKVDSKVVVDDEGNEHVEPVVTPVPGNRTHWGFIAQEIKAAVDAAGVDFGGWVLSDSDNTESQQALRYDQFIAPLVKAVQEQQAQIDSLKAQIAELKGA